MDKLSWKKSALVRSKILGLFVNTLTAEYTYSSQYSDFDAKSSDAIIFKTEDFLWIFSVSENTMNGEHFQKKGVSLA